MNQYFPLYRSSEKKNIKVELDLRNYATKTGLISHVGASSFALKTNLANLKSEVDKIDIAKLTPVPEDLAKLSNVVKNDTGFFLKAKYNTDKSDLETKISGVDKKICDTSGLVKKNNTL